MGEVFRKNVIL